MTGWRKTVFGTAFLVWATAAGLVDAARAQSQDVFTVPRVRVEARADSAGVARKTAQAEGRARAMDILLRRLTIEDDWPYLPTLVDDLPPEGVAELDGKAPIAIDAASLTDLESGFVVYGEKSSSRTYRAEITYRFKADDVRRALRNARIPYSEAQTRTALVIPVLETDTRAYLWEANNPWLAAWRARPLTHELTPLSVPLGDLEDVSRIDVKAALALDEDALADMADHYGVSQVVVAHARLSQADGEDDLTVRLINGYRRSAAVAPSLEVEEAALLTGGDAAPAPAPAPEFGGETGDVLVETQEAAPTGDFPALAERAIERAVAAYGQDWKRRTLIDYGVEQMLEGTAFFRDVSEWGRIRGALVDTPLVGSVQISALSRQGAEMRLRVFGDPSRLVTAMEGQGLSLWTETNDRWFIATPETARDVRGRRFLTAGDGPRRRRTNEDMLRGLSGDDGSPYARKYQDQDR